VLPDMAVKVRFHEVANAAAAAVEATSAAK